MFLLFHSGVFSGAKAVSFRGCEVSTIQDFAELLLEIVATDSTGANDRVGKSLDFGRNLGLFTICVFISICR